MDPVAVVVDRHALIRTRLSQALNGVANVSTVYTPIDVLTSTHVVIIRELVRWSEGLGLLDAASAEFPRKQRHLHLFNIAPNEALLTKIITLANQLHIMLTFEQ